MLRISDSRIRLGLLTMVLVGTSSAVLAQGFDASGDGALHGDYFVRQISCSSIAADGTNGGARSLTGTITFDGAGSFSFAGQVMDASSGSGLPASYTVTGTYAVASNNLIQMTNPLDSTLTMSGALGVSALVASTPSGGNADLLVAIPAATTSVSQATLQGTYWMGLLDFQHGNSLLARDALFSVSATGTGSFGTFVISGNAVNLGISPVSQTITGGAYTLTSNGSGTATFPVPAGFAVESMLISGNKNLFVSGDGNMVLGGAPDGYDLLVGMKTIPPPVGNAQLKNLYYEAGIWLDFSPLRTGGVVTWTSHFGSFNASGTGVSIWHEHLHTPGGSALDYTFDSEYGLGSNGSLSEFYYREAVGAQVQAGAEGQAFLLTGNADNYALALSVRAPAFTTSLSPTGVFLNPSYVANAANFAPITNPIAPGELVSLYGSGLAPTTAATPNAPYPPQIAGVSVSMNGLAAPIYQVSAGRIDCIVPYAVADKSPFVTIQVNNNGRLSNPAMVYASGTAPGIFTLSQDGIGDGAILHQPPNYSVVSSTAPAQRGETVQVFLTGLGKVSPSIADGAPGAANPLSSATAAVAAFIDGQPATVIFAGLAPGYPGLYQVNVQVPAGASSGDVYLDISTPSAYHSQARIFVGP